MACRIVLVGRDGSPEKATLDLVVPDLGQPERDDEYVRAVQQRLGTDPDFFRVAERGSIVAWPQLLRGDPVFVRPFELLANHEGVHHSFPEAHHIGIAVLTVLGGCNVVIALPEVSRNVLRKAAAERTIFVLLPIIGSGGNQPASTCLSTAPLLRIFSTSGLKL